MIFLRNYEQVEFPQLLTRINSLNADALRQRWLSFDEESANLSNQIIEIDTAATGLDSYRIAKPISTFCYSYDYWYEYRLDETFLE